MDLLAQYSDSDGEVSAPQIRWMYCCWKKSCTSWYVVYPISYRVLHMPGGAGFLPSTVWCMVSSFGRLRRAGHLKVVEAVKCTKFDKDCCLLNSALCWFVLYDCTNTPCDRWRLLVAAVFAAAAAAAAAAAWIQWRDDNGLVMLDHGVFHGQLMCLFKYSSLCDMNICVCFC